MPMPQTPHKIDARAVALRCIFCGWWVSGRPHYVRHILPMDVALRALMNHFARYHGRVI